MAELPDGYGLDKGELLKKSSVFSSQSAEKVSGWASALCVVLFRSPVRNLTLPTSNPPGGNIGGGDWIASSIAAGASAGVHAQFGNANAALNDGNSNDDLLLTILFNHTRLNEI